MKRSPAIASPTLARDNKFHAQGFRDAQGTWWASKAEFRRWFDLKMMEKAGHITGLERQKRFPLLSHEGVEIGAIVIDFAYIENGRQILDDTKGVLTDLAQWKLHHLAADYDVEVRLNGVPVGDRPKRKRRSAA